MFPLVSAYPPIEEDAFANILDTFTGYTPINLPTAQAQGRGLKGVGASGTQGHSPTSVSARAREIQRAAYLCAELCLGLCDPRKLVITHAEYSSDSSCGIAVMGALLTA